ncbi:copper-translocating P-type ATPase [Candidatus Peregrinibacteria bacterium]|nr:copper-translocating P-type ATPase [Candidatus Peregrinibacteria bacterium]
MKESYFKIADMHCASCVNRIETALKKKDGIHHASVNFATQKAVVHYDNEKITEQGIIETIKKTGYTAKIMEDETSNQMSHENHTNHSQHDEHDKKKHEDHSMHAKSEAKEEVTKKLKKVIVGAILSTIIVGLALSQGIDNKMYIMFFATLIILIYTGREFFLKGIPVLFQGRPHMDTLVALGVGAAFLYSTYLTFFTEKHEEYFIDAAIISTFIMLGRYLEARAKGKASEAIQKLLQLSAKEAHRLKEDGSIENIPLNMIAHGDKLIVKPGEKIPVDGEIIEGIGVIDESMVTGESIPVGKGVGEKIIGATINGNSAFTMRAEKVGKETLLAQIIKLVEEAQMSKAPIQKLVDKISEYFVWGVIIIALGTFLSWYLIKGDPAYATIVTVAVLIIACPCALGLATPISIVVGSGKGAQMGILIKKAESLEKIHKLTTICFDKTGTITMGKPQITGIEMYQVPEEGYKNFALSNISPKDKEQYENKVLEYITALENASEHPLSRAIIKYAQEKGVKIIKVEKSEAVIGKGIKGNVEGHEIIVGNKTFLENEKVMLCAELEEKASLKQKDGHTIMHVAIDKKYRGFVSVRDNVKESSKEAIQKLHERKIKTIMLTGDHEDVAKAIAREVGIDEIRSEVTPDKKTDIIKELQKANEFVGMVGDGINDSPALSQANVGIAMGTGTDIAIESGDMVLVKGDLKKAVEAIELSEMTLKNIKQNLFWAFIYNVIGIPVAAFALLNPIISASAMAFSSISVVLNALRLKRFKPSK